MAICAAFFCLACLISCGSSSSSSSHVPPPPRGCGIYVDPPYRVLCDLESVWGVVLEAVACGGVLSSLVLSAVLLVKLRCICDPDRRSGLGPLLLLLATLTGLFSLSLAYLVGKNQALCVVRRALWGPLFALCFSCLLVQGLRLRKLVAGKSSPTGSSLAGLGAALALVQGIISGEWVLLTVVREGHPACDYPPVDFALTCAYTLGLLLVAMGLSLGVVLCGGEMETSEREEADRSGEDEKKKWRCNGVWLFLSCLASALLWVAWLGFYLYGNPALRAKGRAERSGSGGRRGSKVWDEPALAVALVTQGWILLILHAIPEAHLCLRRPLSAAAPDYFDSTQPRPPPHFDSTQPRPPPHFGEERPTHPHRPFADNQAFSMEEQSTTLRGTYRSNQGSLRPGIPYRGHVYQPTEMALVMNGGAMPTAPINYTGRQLW
ncbi:G-protein coupled receptor family C group 5 member B [Merluccius polli]|uniref:G-protein coupled receptor family C group 5 member B n=1 Tax=Merluccius polli TaxID=89951 RepID=A0AA47N4G0_MERPO|nr:G-protein coupled receptor family C group 5 member B [Merluccius polli]